MMKHIFYTISILVFLLVAITACETYDDVDYTTMSYTSVSVKIDFQADKEATYKILLDEKEVKAGSHIFVLDELENVFLQVYKNDETTPELERKIELVTTGATTISLVQLPDSPIALAGAGVEEEDPQNRNSVKMRLFYANESLGNSIRLDIYAADGTIWPMEWQLMASQTLERGQFGPYFEVDLAMFEPESGAEWHTAGFSCDVTNLDTNEKLFDHEDWAVSLDFNGDTYLGPDENGDRSAYKFISSELVFDIGNGWDYGSNQFAFGTLWEDMVEQTDGLNGILAVF